MPGRARDTKTRSLRIDREYFKRLYPIPRWRRVLSLAFSVAGLAWVGWSTLAGAGEVFNAGPLDRKHHLLGGNCTACHIPDGIYWRKVTAMGCTACHDGPQHQEQEVNTPACTSCHVDHRGSFALAEVGDASCTQCHANLETRSGKLNVAANVTDFAAGHPKFRSERGELQDTGTIKFGHQAHMKPDLRGPDGPVQLQCSSCHTLRVDGTMTMAERDKHCASCHPLEFYRRIQDVLPHDKPEVVLAYARRSFETYIAANPGDVNFEDPPLDPRILSPRPGPAGNAAEWIRRRMEETQILMARKTCLECHTPVLAGGSVQAIPPANLLTTWMTGAHFDHKPHQMVACASCHGNVEQSRDSSDVLMPGIASCQGCHRPGGASASCAECHYYHDWSKAKVVEPRFQIEDFRR